MTKISFDNCRTVPKNASDRVYGEGDVVWRDKKTHRITYWNVGNDKDRNRDPSVYKSVAMYDTKKMMLI